ncbi:TetR/AcrR family transcriptional regulator [Murimonas intestini]|uniref:TetR/AcrR family transcriptional regulator n=1 Tax=Murimonas intestini TaxID=1337051 RepID=UPI0011DD302F|nr:TetR/AcrR family transcriptional regulator [Murimonas intestini]
MNKQPEITDATREAFITAFFRLAEIKNIYKITIKEITNLAGYNRTTFYRYFEDVFNLIEYAEDQFIDGMLSVLLPQIQMSPVLDNHFFQLFLEHFYASKDRLGILLRDSNRAAFIRRLQQRLQASLNAPIDISTHNRVIMDIYFNGIFSAIIHQIQYPDEMSDEELLSIISSLFTKWYWPAVNGKKM